MNLCFKFLSLLEVPYNKKTVQRFFNTHSNHPSILSISDLLDEFNIDNAAVRIRKENFNQIDTPFIAKTESSEGDFCLIEKIRGEEVTYLNEQDETITETLEQFYLQYSGVVLVAETNQNSAEPNYIQNKKKYSNQNLVVILFLSVFATISFIALAFQQNNVSAIALYIIKAIGTSVSVLLLIQSLNANNPFINKLCSTASGNGCENILNSAAAKIFNGKLSWSEVGFFYFTSTLFALSINPTIQTLLVLAAINLLTLPYTIYSIYYQYKIAKQWCKLCLSIQILLWLEFAISCFNYNSSVSSNSLLIPVSIIVAVFFFVVSLWFLIKPFITTSLLADKLQKDINQFKKDENIFNTLLQQQKTVSPLNEQYKIIFGNPKANFEITFVSNPYCNPCAETHHKLKALLNDERENLKLNIIYTVAALDTEPKNKIIHILISIYKMQGAIATENAMEEWYSNNFKNSEEWIKKYSGFQKNDVTQIMEQHRVWSDENEITHTPMLFINNQLYLSEYNLNDLKHFIHLSAKNNYAQAVPTL
jgi:hypothetical protein